MGKKKKKGTGWKHPKTGEWWSSKQGYHKYWKKYIVPNLKKKKQPEPVEEDFDEWDTEPYYDGYYHDYDSYGYLRGDFAIDDDGYDDYDDYDDDDDDYQEDDYEEELDDDEELDLEEELDDDEEVDNNEELDDDEEDKKLDELIEYIFKDDKKLDDSDLKL